MMKSETEIQNYLSLVRGATHEAITGGDYSVRDILTMMLPDHPPIPDIVRLIPELAQLVKREQVHHQGRLADVPIEDIEAAITYLLAEERRPES